MSHIFGLSKQNQPFWKPCIRLGTVGVGKLSESYQRAIEQWYEEYMDVK